MEVINIIIICLIGIFIFLELLFLYLKNENLRKIFKCFPLLLTSILFLLIDYKAFYIPSIIAFLYALGDFFLLSLNKKLFFAGALSFAFGHMLLIFYLFFTKIFLYNLLALIISLFVILIFMIIFFIYMKDKMKSFIYGGCFYLSLLLFIFLYSLASTFINNPTTYIALIIGSLTYFVSDILVMKERFIKDTKYLNLAIMSLYYLSNILIFVSLYIF